MIQRNWLKWAGNIVRVFSMVSVLVTAATWAGDGAAAPRERWGYGDLKFGMTIAEADALRTDDRIENCEYVGFSRCLVWDDVAFGRKARFDAKIAEDSQTIAGLVISIKDFSRKRGYPCQAVADDVVKRISDTYGKPTCGTRRINCTWPFKDGGSVATAIFCPTHDPSSGFVNIQFSDAANASE